MKKFLSVIILFTLIIPAQAQVMEVGISKNGAFNQIIDTQTNMPVSNAKVSLPMQNYTTYTDQNGSFDLAANINDSSILSVEKSGYRPFSLTINDKIAAKPMIIGIEKSNIQDITIATELFHLGDNNYSDASANSSEFQAQPVGPKFTKKVNLSPNTKNKTNYLVIGSIIGIDTLMARVMNQNKITTSFSSPPEVYFNGEKIAEIQLNGDNQKIKLPNRLINAGMQNEIMIKTGRNLQQTAYIDYDDIEIMNLSIQSE